MGYDFEFLFIESSLNRWVLSTISGRIIFESRHRQRHAALEECRAYVSSWNSVRIMTREEYEQEKQRNNVYKPSSGDDTSD